VEVGDDRRPHRTFLPARAPIPVAGGRVIPATVIPSEYV
jgi:hypothetical protein